MLDDHDDHTEDPQQTPGTLCWPLGGGAFIQWWWLWICARTLRHVAGELEKRTDTGGIPSVCRWLITENFQRSLGHFVAFHASLFLFVLCFYQSYFFVSCHVHCSTVEHERLSGLRRVLMSSSGGVSQHCTEVYHCWWCWSLISRGRSWSTGG